MTEKAGLGRKKMARMAVRSIYDGERWHPTLGKEGKWFVRGTAKKSCLHNVDYAP